VQHLGLRATLRWLWLVRQFSVTATYWIIAISHRRPHQWPVFWIWSQRRLYLSVGSPSLLWAIREEPAVTNPS
jgi:hypothetical protein